MRFTAALLLSALALTGCSQADQAKNSPSPTGSQASGQPTSSMSSNPSSSSNSSQPSNSGTASSTLNASIKQARGVAVSADLSQVECAKGATKVVGAQAQMQAPDLDELFLVAMIGCAVNGTTGAEVPEVFHWRDNAWTTVATIRINIYTVEPIGTFQKINENKLHLKVKATDKNGASITSTLEVRRDGLSYWADVLA